MRDYEWELSEQYQAIQEWKKKKEFKKSIRRNKMKKFFDAISKR